MGEARPDGRVERGNQTRQLVLARAVQVASTQGLDGLSLGRLATELKLSKSGVFALFGSKEELQLATVRTAVAIFVDHVLTPTRAVDPGLGRVWRMCESWLTYSRTRVFRGGCFFYATIAEFDSRKGKVHDALAATQTGWVTFVEETLEEARVRGELAADTDVSQLAFELIAFMELANAESVLHDNAPGYAKATKAILGRLRGVVTDPALLPATA
ncbi:MULTISPECIES: TetR/AcrR family transcriptional regulator [unclassified Streptomyces]|uniref:TetR/AcrR family transcriptional regulator n=1 Tax=Streptomyces TaxID=1883 RepID=UPI0001C18FD0|nr:MULTISPECIES: TetR/AcrR family transcriptional regulator [unclassified Streptomyces]AEN13293.1 transcriptional regulator, TetR family [Streptomyces sp. SirexAA-E]MYR65263.1 TetR family transcriptional regulator [Streptomyces sp. SID4939]MYS04826.1 TetR family transcriptional regulator [Streptomyces sp. SID4940]MYT67258.1 TetR family transcriptional regulator [Streptomyces sp. SID8357]MYT88056.1 TetR family transcriptional regulator [Streptomyces sp. SID8360]